MVHLQRVHHVGYFTDNLEAAIERYGKAFPIDQVVHGESAVLNARIAFVRTGGIWIEVMEPADKSVLGGKTGMILHHTAYEVVDIDAAITELRAAGIRFRPGVPSLSPAGRIAYLEDDQAGITVHLVEPGEGFR